MSKPLSPYSHFATLLPVQDIEKSIKFYQEKLGFEVTFTWKNPVEYAVLKGGDQVAIHLTKREDKLQPSPVHTALYIFVHDVDDLYTDLNQRGVEILTPLGDRDYYMRDFDIKDPDGYILCFGKG